MICPLHLFRVPLRIDTTRRRRHTMARLVRTHPDVRVDAKIDRPLGAHHAPEGRCTLSSLVTARAALRAARTRTARPCPMTTYAPSQQQRSHRASGHSTTRRRAEGGGLARPPARAAEATCRHRCDGPSASASPPPFQGRRRARGRRRAPTQLGLAGVDRREEAHQQGRLVRVLWHTVACESTRTQRKSSPLAGPARRAQGRIYHRAHRAVRRVQRRAAMSDVCRREERTQKLGVQIARQ